LAEDGAVFGTLTLHLFKPHIVDTANEGVSTWLEYHLTRTSLALHPCDHLFAIVYDHHAQIAQAQIAYLSGAKPCVGENEKILLRGKPVALNG
jgi:hypothetical protein